MAGERLNLGGDNAAGDAVSGIAGGIGAIVVGRFMDNEGSAVLVEQRRFAAQADRGVEHFDAQFAVARHMKRKSQAPVPKNKRRPLG